MRKHLFYSFGLALLSMAWGGADNAAQAQIQLSDVKSVNFDNETGEYIPTGWIVYNKGTERTSGTKYGSDSRLKSFPNSTLITNALYVVTGEDGTESSAIYGNLKDYELSIPAGYVEVKVPAFLWDGETGKVKVEVLKYEAGKAVSELESVVSVTQSITATTATFTTTTEEVDGETKTTTTTNKNGANAALESVDYITLYFQNAERANYVIKCATTGKYSAFAITGFTVSCDHLAVFAENFYNVADNYTPATGSGWTLYDVTTTTTTDDDGTKTETSENRTKTKGISYSGDGSRVFVLTGCSEMSHAMYHQAYGSSDNRYEIYGTVEENEPTLTLTGGMTYDISLNAAIWTGSPEISVYLLNSNNEEVASQTMSLTTTNTLNRNKATEFTPDLIKFSAAIKTTGNYMLKVTSKGQIVYSNIAIRQSLEVNLDEKFTDLKNKVPASGSGWILYNNSTAITQGSEISRGARMFSISGQSEITNVAYMGWDGTGYLTYGEVGSGKSLILEGNKKYRITYYASNWDGKTTATRQMKCEIYGVDSQAEIFSRTDILDSKCNGDAGTAKFNTTPDFIQATFTPKTTGEYILKFTSIATVVANISLKEITDNVIFEGSFDKFGYATVYLGEAVGIPDGCTAYIGKLIEDNTSVKLTALTGTVIPKETAVILSGTPSASFTLSPSSETSSDETSDNVLKGTLCGIKSPSGTDVYILGYKSSDDTDKFYRNSTSTIKTTTTTTIDESAGTATITTKTETTTGSSTDTKETETTENYTAATEATDGKASHTAGTTNSNSERVRVIRANKVYLEIPTTTTTGQSNASSIRIQFDETEEPGIETAIEQVKSEATAKPSGVIYDLRGRRVVDMSKPGLYIVDGRKVLVK